MTAETDGTQQPGSDRRSIARHDDTPLWRCPQLGGPVDFGYCRQMSEGMPCGRLVICWSETLDVAAFLEQHYSPAQIAEIESRATRGRIDIISQTLQRVLGQSKDTA